MWSVANKYTYSISRVLTDYLWSRWVRWGSAGNLYILRLVQSGSGLATPHRAGTCRTNLLDGRGTDRRWGLPLQSDIPGNLRFQGSSLLPDTAVCCLRLLLQRIEPGRSFAQTCRPGHGGEDALAPSRAHGTSHGPAHLHGSRRYVHDMSRFIDIVLTKFSVKSWTRKSFPTMSHYTALW